MTKSVFKSKTFWFNFGAAALAFLEANGALLGPQAYPVIAGVVALGNIALRYFTSDPVSVSGK